MQYIQRFFLLLIFTFFTFLLFYQQISLILHQHCPSHAIYSTLFSFTYFYFFLHFYFFINRFHLSCTNIALRMQYIQRFFLLLIFTFFTFLLFYQQISLILHQHCPSHAIYSTLFFFYLFLLFFY